MQEVAAIPVDLPLSVAKIGGTRYIQVLDGFLAKWRTSTPVDGKLTSQDLGDNWRAQLGSEEARTVPR